MDISKVIIHPILISSFFTSPLMAQMHYDPYADQTVVITPTPVQQIPSQIPQPMQPGYPPPGQPAYPQQVPQAYPPPVQQAYPAPATTYYPLPSNAPCQGYPANPTNYIPIPTANYPLNEVNPMTESNPVPCNGYTPPPPSDCGVPYEVDYSSCCNMNDSPAVWTSQGRNGITCATRAGEVAAISCAEMAAAAAVVGAIALLALAFHGGNAHAH